MVRDLRGDELLGEPQAGGLVEAHAVLRRADLDIAMTDPMSDAAKPAAVTMEGDRDLAFEQAEIVGEASDRQAQRPAVLWALGGGVAVGVVLFPMLAAFAPGGSFLAAWATGNADRWQAGVSLIQAGSPERAAALSAATRLVNANVEALQACRRVIVTKIRNITTMGSLWPLPSGAFRMPSF